MYTYDKSVKVSIHVLLAAIKKTLKQRWMKMQEQYNETRN